MRRMILQMDAHTLTPAVMFPIRRFSGWRRCEGTGTKGEWGFLVLVRLSPSPLCAPGFGKSGFLWILFLAWLFLQSLFALFFLLPLLRFCSFVHSSLPTPQPQGSSRPLRHLQYLPPHSQLSASPATGIITEEA